MHLQPGDYSTPSTWWAQAARIAAKIDSIPSRAQRMRLYRRSKEGKFAVCFRRALQVRLSKLGL
jgi:hypothetical protein